jgi:hypothetical protein
MISSKFAAFAIELTACKNMYFALFEHVRPVRHFTDLPDIAQAACMGDQPT